MLRHTDAADALSRGDGDELIFLLLRMPDIRHHLDADTVNGRAVLEGPCLAVQGEMSIHGVHANAEEAPACTETAESHRFWHCALRRTVGLSAEVPLGDQDLYRCHLDLIREVADHHRHGLDQ